MVGENNRVELLKNALAEVRANKHVFSTETYSQLVYALFERLRIVQTRFPEGTPGDRDEIRLVTVMFIDVKDSTELAQKLTAEPWRQIIAESHSKVGAVITEWGGEIGQYLGDGLLCFFGARHSRSDDAVRAVSAALDVQNVIYQYAVELAQRYQGTTFGIRIGISTGRVVVGDIGSSDNKQEFLALGPSTNLASRLQAICPPGGIYIDTETHRRTRNHFQMQRQKPVYLKGFDNPVEHYLVEQRRERPAVHFTETRIAGLETPFVGRNDELAHIQLLCERALTDEQFHAITVYGEVGIGKSRLLQEVVNRTAEKSFTQFTMIAEYDSRGISYNLLRDMLVKNCDLSDEMDADRARQRIISFVRDTWNSPHANSVAAVLGYLTGYEFENNPHVQALKRGSRGQERTAFAWISRWFRGMLETDGLLLVVDNLQWADQGSRDLLGYLVQDLKDTSGILLAAARPEFSIQMPYYMQDYPHHTPLLLEPFTAEATMALLKDVLSRVERVPDTLMPIISERSDGNPLFISELLSMFFESEVFQPDGEGVWIVNRLAYEATIQTLPNGLIGVLQARLDDLPTVSRRMIQVAAVVGQTFWSGIIAQITHVEPTSIFAELVERGIVEQLPESSIENEIQYRFRHTLYRDVAYEMLPRAKREGYHGTIAAWLEERTADKPEFLPMLAEQYEAGSQPEKAMRAYLQATQNRIDRGLMDESLVLIDKGLALAGKVPREVALPIASQLWLARGQAYNTLNRFDEATAACQSAIRLFDELPPESLLEARIEAYRLIGNAYRSLGRYTESLDSLQQAYAIVPEHDVLQLASVLRSFGTLFLARGRLGESISYQQRAYTLAQQAGSDRQQTRTGSMTQLGLIALDRGDLGSALSYFERVLDINKNRENIHFQVLDLRNIGAVYRALFAHEIALDAFDKAEELQKTLQYTDSMLKAYRALCWIALGRADEGMNLLREAHSEGHQDAPSALQLSLLFVNGLALVGQYKECCQEARILADKALDLNPIIYGRALLWLGTAQSVLGERAEALTTLETALNYELEYGGLDSWHCYHALAMASENTAVSRDYYEKAASIFRAISSSLHSRPDLQIMLLNNDFVRAIFVAAE